MIEKILFEAANINSVLQSYNDEIAVIDNGISNMEVVASNTEILNEATRMKAELMKTVSSLVDKNIIVMNLISSLCDFRMKIIIINHYFHHKELAEISCENNWSYRNTIRLHGEAIKALEAAYLSASSVSNEEQS